MKVVFSILLAVSALSSFAKDDVSMKAFNKKLMQNIDTVVGQNPHIYETKDNYKTKSKGRMPASVLAVEPDQQLDEIEEQADTAKSW